jgi:hypothetical protein
VISPFVSSTHADRTHLPRRIVPMLMLPILVKGRVSRFIRFGMSMVGNLLLNSTFLGIAIHNVSASLQTDANMDFAAGIRQDASGLLGTTVKLADLVSVSALAADSFT